jgi:hypothetical protein
MNGNFNPMTLADMREDGVYSVIATCEACGHKSNENVDAYASQINRSLTQRPEPRHAAGAAGRLEGPRQQTGAGSS